MVIVEFIFNGNGNAISVDCGIGEDVAWSTCDHSCMLPCDDISNEVVKFVFSPSYVREEFY